MIIEDLRGVVGKKGDRGRARSRFLAALSLAALAIGLTLSGAVLAGSD
jgi:hypothetical protein